MEQTFELAGLGGKESETQDRRGPTTEKGRTIRSPSISYVSFQFEEYRTCETLQEAQRSSRVSERRRQRRRRLPSGELRARRICYTNGRGEISGYDIQIALEKQVTQSQGTLKSECRTHPQYCDYQVKNAAIVDKTSIEVSAFPLERHLYGHSFTELLLEGTCEEVVRGQGWRNLLA